MKKQVTLFLLAASLASLQHATAQSWNITGNSNATTSSKLGTTNSIPLRLYTNNTQRVTITADGKMGVNTTAPPGLFTVQSNGSVPNAKWAPTSTQPVFFGFSENLNADFSLAAASNDPKQRPLFFGKRARGTLASPSAVKTDDYLTSMAVYAYDGSAFQIPATIDFYADGTPSSGKVPSRISFVTGSNAGDRLERLKIGSTGDINFNNGQMLIKQADGNVGIGGTPSGYKLSVYAGAAAGIYSNTTGSYGVFSQATENGYGFYTSGGYYGTISYGTKYGVYGFGALNGLTGYSNSDAGSGVYASNGGNSGYGVYGAASSSSGFGVFGSGFYGVRGEGQLGVYGYTTNYAGDAVHGTATGSTGYGVYAISNSAYGIYANTGNTSSYAGYFNGNVYTTGAYQTSDVKLKKNIKAVDNALDIINKLQPKYYEFRTDGSYAKMNLPTGLHYGLIAQDVEKVLPGLVKQTQFDVARNTEPDVKSFTADSSKPSTVAAIAQPVTKGEVIDFKAVNYTELIPVLVKAIQEQQQQIEELKVQLSQLTPAKDVTTNLNSVSLEQNNPNPLDKSTTIRYSLPTGSTNAHLLVTDMSGKTIKQLQLTSPQGSVNIDATGLAAGSYSYSIVVNGKLMQTKKMVVAKSKL